jgi:hypothetical protein
MLIRTSGTIGSSCAPYGKVDLKPRSRNRRRGCLVVPASPEQSGSLKMGSSQGTGLRFSRQRTYQTPPLPQLRCAIGRTLASHGDRRAAHTRHANSTSAACGAAIVRVARVLLKRSIMHGRRKLSAGG